MDFLDVPRRMDEVQIKQEYTSSLKDLVTNRKSLINRLTFLARENRRHAGHIVAAIEEHLDQDPVDLFNRLKDIEDLAVETGIKLYVLYLIDSILKHIGGEYITLFSQNIVSSFEKVFQVAVDVETKRKLYVLRTTWNKIFPPMLLLLLDTVMNRCDAAWPISLDQSLYRDTSKECIELYRRLVRQQQELDMLDKKKRCLELEEERLNHLSSTMMLTSFQESSSQQQIQISELDLNCNHSDTTKRNDEQKETPMEENVECIADVDDDDDVIFNEVIPDVIVIDNDCDSIQIPGLDLICNNNSSFSLRKNLLN